METSTVNELYDFAELCGKNPYLEGRRIRVGLMDRKLLKKFGDRERIVQAMIQLAQDLAQECVADDSADGDRTDREELVWTSENVLAMVVLGTLRYAAEKEWQSDHFDDHRYMRLLTSEIRDALSQRTWNAVGVLAAAWRCESHLDNELKGASAALVQSRAAVWSAAFGDSLSTAMRYHRIIRKQNVLIYGESGSGKEEAARALMEGTFQDSGISCRPCHSINVAAIQPNLIESELFGHVKGAFTGADRNKTGAIQSADNGTLFLDEIGELPRHLQSKFLRVMETGRVQPVGGGKDIDIDVRYIAATHRHLETMVMQQKFRLDFFYRLYGVGITLPRLADIIQMDLSDLVEKFMPPDKTAETGTVTELIRRQYAGHTWPGNVRELRNLIYDFILRGLDRSPLRPTFETAAGVTPKPVAGDELPQEIITVGWTETELIDWYRNRAMNKFRTRNKAADALGCHPRTLERFSKKEKNHEHP